MLRSKPRLSYCGLTIILSNPSRFDKMSLLSSTGGHLLNAYCLQPDYNVMQTDVRECEDTSPWLDGTRCILLLGEKAMHTWVPHTRKNSLNEMRGSPLAVGGIPAIASYLPQDCVDAKNYEKEFNERAEDSESSEKDTDSDSDSNVKAIGSTARSNYSFWLFADTNKCKKILRSGLPSRSVPSYVLNPSPLQVIALLHTAKNHHLYFDIETDYEDQNLLCFAFSFDGQTIYSVPILDYAYRCDLSVVTPIIRALAIAFRDNIVVAHNGATFDFLVMAMKYHICVRRSYDTMIAMHRCFPAVEKSLGHCTSYWTWEVFHKDEDSKSYRTSTDMHNKLAYCGKDVYTMFLIHQAITAYAKRVPGLEASITCAMDSIRPYLTCTMQGIRYDEDAIDRITDENDRLMMQYDRAIRILIGPSGMDTVHKVVKGKPGLFAGSNKQCCAYFHEMMEYPVLFRSDKTGEPSLGKKMMYRLQLKHNNPVITFANMYRKTQKETGALSFNPWRDDEGHRLPRIKEIEE